MLTHTCSPMMVFVLLTLGLGCNKRPSDGQASAGPTASSTAPASSGIALPPDRLAPGELRASAQLAFGFPIPDGMTIDRVFPRAIHLVGEVSVPGLLRYIQERSTTSSPELQGNTFVFSSVKLPGAESQRRFVIEVTSQLRTTRLMLKDVTPTVMTEPPAQSDEERWRRAGLKPNGEIIDVTQLQ